MTGLRTGAVVHQEIVSETLIRFRLAPEEGFRFPDYEAGQAISLRRDDCKLTRKIGVGPDGKPICEPERDPWGRQTVGPVTQFYSIASAPSDTAEHGWLEFLVAVEHGVHGLSGRLSEALFGADAETGCEVGYQDRIVGSFTLAERTGDAASVLMVGTGAGVAPFVSMLRELRAQAGGGDGRRYTLIHGARTEADLACRAALFEIEAAGRFDFLYVPTVSRPAAGADRAPGVAPDPRVGRGRASNVVRHVYGLPTAEEEKQARAVSEVTKVAADLALQRLVRPVLAGHLSAAELAARVAPAETVLLACGNPASVGDVEATAKRRQVRFERDSG